ncbi:cytochrome P450 [Crassisporium funariophilum]|nr:cytochrome P450 [Crassisporium funariophilum]
MVLPVVQAVSCFVLSIVVWRVVRQYWVTRTLRNIPGPPSQSIWTGVLPQLFDSVNGWKFHREIAERYGGVSRIKGVLGENQLYVFDPKALHHILVKDQLIYEETDAFVEGNKLLFGEGILSALGDRHRRHRKMLNPVFSAAHLRGMIPTFYSVAYKVRDTFVKKLTDGPLELDVLSWMTRLALELIGQSGLGYSFDTLTEDEVSHPYSKAAKQLVCSMILRNLVLPTIVNTGFKFPRLSRFIIEHLPIQTVQEVKVIADILRNTSVEIIESKKRALEAGDAAVEHQIGQGKDIISILMKDNLNASEHDRLTDTELIGQVTSLTFAATDTTSGALSRILHMLATHQKVQEELRAEVTNARKEYGDLDFDQLLSLPYLDAVCRESLRMYICALPVLARQDILLPLKTPIKGQDGQEIHEIHVPKGTEIHVSIIGANQNPEIWGPDAYEWKPERWLQPLPSTVVDARVPGIYSHLMTFLGGGRACIGFKFSQLEMKVVLSVLLESFHFAPAEKEVFWQMNIITTPNVNPKGIHPNLPLKVSLVHAGL